MSENYLTLAQNDISDIQNKIDYIFKDKRLLSKAFTHSSVVNENKKAMSNERLEFLGDRILNFICAEELFFNEAGSEGRLTTLLKNKVSKTPLAKSVLNLDLFRYLIKSKGAKFDDDNEKAVSDIYEALLGAIYIDSGSIDECKNFVKKTLLTVEIIDYISLVKEYIEKNTDVKYDENIFEDTQTKQFTCKICINGSSFDAFGKNKDEAKKEAAKKICEHLKLCSQN